MLGFKLYNVIDPKTGKLVDKMNILVNWINEKLKKREWENLDRVSEVKYFISFVPLFHKRFLNRKKIAKDVGLSYDVFRKFSTEEKVKELTDTHLREFASLFFTELMFTGDDYLKLIAIAGSLYSPLLIIEITNTISAYREDAIRAATRDDDAFMKMDEDMFNDALMKGAEDINEIIKMERAFQDFSNIWANEIEKTDKNLYLKIQMIKLQNMLIWHNYMIGMSKALFEKGQLDLSVFESICSMGKNNQEDVAHILKKMK